MNHIEAAMQEAAALTKTAYQKAAAAGLLPLADLPEPSVEIPRDSANGDFCTTAALSAARTLRMAPAKIAAAIVSQLDLSGSSFAAAEIAGAGFINFTLSPSWYSRVITNVLAEGRDYGRSSAARPEKIMVEFVSANPTGPMHMGNARGGVLCDCIASVLELTGNEVYREFLINDAGNQVDKFARSLNVRCIQLVRGEDSIEFPEDGYHGDDVKALAADFMAANPDALDIPEPERLVMMRDFGISRNIAAMKRDLSRYRINYDRWFSETELHNSGYVAETMQLLTDRGYTYEKDGALWLKTTELGCEKDDVLMRGNGFYTYFAVDIAYHRDKFERRGFDRVINVWGADHHGHVARLKGALDALGLDGTHRLEIVLMQLVRLTRDGEVVRMSKRTGKAITLSDLLDEISVDAARFFFNSRRHDSHLEFDLGLAVRQDSENPVYYVQYAHARMMSILKNLEASGFSADASLSDADLSVLNSPAEIALIKTLAAYPENVRQAAVCRDPSLLDRYASDTASAFHKFYTESRIIGAPDELMRPRVALLRAAHTVIANVLAAIGVDAPEHM